MSNEAHESGDMVAQVPDEAAPLLASVVIPCRNRTEMLRDMMRGLAAQSLGLSRFEVVMVDNCSTEDLSVVVEYGQSLGLTVRMGRTKENRGPAPARNLGATMAVGPIIAFIDSDCRPDPNWLETALPRFDDPKVGMVCGPVLFKPEQTLQPLTRLGCTTAKEHPTYPTANFVVRRSTFWALNGFDETLSYVDPWNRTLECADTDFAWRIVKAGYGRVFVPESVVYHEMETQSLLRWWFDPSRAFGIGPLVRLHPELRSILLTFGVFFYPPAAAMYVVVPVAVFIAIYAPVWLWVLPVPMALRAALRARSLAPGKILAGMGRQLLHLPRMLVTCATMIYTSVRFRTLVL